jgi:phage-related protein
MKLREIARGPWVVLAVCNDRGDCQLVDFMGELGGGASAEARKLMAVLTRASQQGPPRSKERSNTLGDGTFEFKSGSLRALYFYGGERLIVCSHGFVKKSQKCPAREKYAAAFCKRRYFEAKRRGELVIQDG